MAPSEQSNAEELMSAYLDHELDAKESEEFEAMFDLTLYRQVRADYGAEGAFPELYEKIRPEVDVFAVLEEEEAFPIDAEDG